MTTIAKELDQIEVLMKAQDIADMVLASEEMIRYIETKEALKKDDLAQEQLRRFQKLKDSYEEVQRFGKYHPDYNQVNEEVRRMKRDVQLIPTVNAFKKAESTLDELLYQVCRVIADGVSATIKVPSDNPLYNMGGSCGTGGCGTGGSCGCGG